MQNYVGLHQRYDETTFTALSGRSGAERAPPAASHLDPSGFSFLCQPFH